MSDNYLNGTDLPEDPSSSNDMISDGKQMNLSDLFDLSPQKEPKVPENENKDNTEEALQETIAYYNNNADAFCERTVNSNMEEQYRFFLKYVSAGARILDFGCGSGRDTKYFRDSGFNVTAVDGSEQMCKKAESYAGINVRQMDFLDLNDREIYAGIWASASLLHIPKKDLPRMFAKLRKALTPEGIMYVSFKEGSFEGMRDGRYFSDLTEGELFNLVNTVGGLKIVEARQFTETHEDGDVNWVSAIIRKW